MQNGKTHKMIKRLMQVLPFMKGEVIVIANAEGQTSIDTGTVDAERARKAAADFFHHTYTTSKS